MEANQSSSNSPMSDDIDKDLESLVAPGEINFHYFFTEVCRIMDLPPEKHILPLARKILATLRDGKGDLEVLRGFGFKRTDDGDELPQSEAKFKCKCNDRFNNLYQLRAHVVKNNENHSTFLFECNVCNKQFSLKCELKLHLESSPSCNQDNASATATAGTSGTSGWNGGGAGVGPEVNLPNGTEEPEVPLETSNLMPPQDLELSIDLDNQSQGNDTDSTSVDVTPPSELEIVEHEDDDLDEEEDDAEADVDTQELLRTESLFQTQEGSDDTSSPSNDVPSSPPSSEVENQQQENGIGENNESESASCLVDIAPPGLNMPTPSPNYGSFGCIMCVQSFMTLIQLRKHEIEYHNFVQQRVWCGLCHETFATFEVFDLHRAGAHDPACNGEQVEIVQVGIRLENDYLPDVDLSQEVPPLVSQDQGSIGLNDNGGEMEEEWLVDVLRRRQSQMLEPEDYAPSPQKRIKVERTRALMKGKRRKDGKKIPWTRRKVHKN